MDKIRRLAKGIVGNTDSKAFYHSVVDLAVESSGAERGLLVKRDGERVSVLSARNVDRETLRGRAAKLSLTIAREAMSQETTLLVEDALNQEIFAGSDSVYDLGLRSVLCVPVWLGGAVVAALYVDSRFIPGAFGAQDAQTLETLADFVALFMWKCEVEESTERHKADTRALNEQLDELRSQLDELSSLSAPPVRAAAVAAAGERGPASFAPIIGTSQPMQRVYSIMRRVLDNDITVLVLGESGTGKELVAQGIFEYGNRKDGPFVAINCSSIPATLIESELFGHLKGAFTGATRDKKGRFEVADGGTLFLDEVGDMPMEMQGKLLRALQYGEIQRLGSVKTQTVDVRVITATNRNLDEMVAAGTFREDLFYRLNIVSIEVPPLRKRKDDLPLLVQRFMELNREQGITEVTGITPQALMALRKYPWPGNVRELETVIKSACLFAEGQHLNAADFEGLVQTDSALFEPADPSYFEGRTLSELERDVILATLRKNNGNKKRTATELGIDRRTLYNKLKRYGFSFAER